VGGLSAVAAGELPAPVFPQDLDGVLVEGDGAASGGGLRVAFDDLVAGGGALESGYALCRWLSSAQ
jgi:hypothetical protein